jgi:hypothetical protein
LPDKSKKVSKFSYAALEIGQAINELGHATLLPKRSGKKANGGER